MGDWKVALPRSRQHPAGMHSTNKAKIIPFPKALQSKSTIPMFSEH